ncbi:thiazole biosynthesis adenylyltransferase ThiF [Clostridia bacterium]|nr:thiazole biosynthesis adenylyltransferase ThiF [Clostridia bacterium]
MKFSQTSPVKIVMLGAGGTGGHIAPHLYRLLYAIDTPARFIICDGDRVERKNLVRQNFIEADLGENKSKVLAERYSSVFGLETEYVPSFVESEEQLTKLITSKSNELVILIGAVDNNKSRKLCHTVFGKSKELVYIDSGNGEFSGQVVCGIRRNRRTYYKPAGTLFPDILESTDKFPTELSCAEASVSAPQSITANIMAATAVVSMVYNILVSGDLSVRMATFSTKSVTMKGSKAA